MTKRSITIRGHRTSVSLEAEFWEALRETAAQDGRTLAALVAEIDSRRGRTPLSSAIRVHLLGRYRALAGGARA
jgi:predicted DNA-binding ribbon-helix-helix protein